MYGLNETVDVKLKFADVNKVYKINFEGLIPYFNEILKDKTHTAYRTVYKNLAKNIVCSECDGNRLHKEALHFKIDNKHIAEIANYDLQSLLNWINVLDKKLNKNQKKIALERKSTRLNSSHVARS